MATEYVCIVEDLLVGAKLDPNSAWNAQKGSTERLKSYERSKSMSLWSYWLTTRNDGTLFQDPPKPYAPSLEVLRVTALLLEAGAKTDLNNERSLTCHRRFLEAVIAYRASLEDPNVSAMADNLIDSLKKMLEDEANVSKQASTIKIVDSAQSTGRRESAQIFRGSNTSVYRPVCLTLLAAPVALIQHAASTSPGVERTVCSVTFIKPESSANNLLARLPRLML